MSATEDFHPTADFAALSLTRLHDPSYWADAANEWLPRRASFELQIGPALGFSRVWREVHVRLQSGPDYLYRYFPFLCMVYVDGCAQTAIEFDAPLQEQSAVLRLPVGVRVRLTFVTELAQAPAGREGSDTRELALRFLGLRLGEDLAQPPRPQSTEPAEHYQLDARASSEDSPRPIFVVGSYRSGTSVLTWALGQHPNVWPMEESGWIAPLADAAILGYRNAMTAPRNFFEVYDVDRREYFAQIGYAVDRFCRNASRRHLHGILLGRLSGRVTDEFNSEFQLARSVMNPKQRWVDGTPENSGYITPMLAIFPLARFISPVRNPIDVVASMLRFERAGGENRGVRASAEMWLFIMRTVLLAYRAFGPQVVHLVRYESLAREPARTLRELFDFLGEPDFPKAADTFSKRINSSEISDDERASLYAEIDGEPEVKAQMLALYEELIDCIGKPWQTDAAAADALEEIENDRIMRIALDYRGGVPLP